MPAYDGKTPVAQVSQTLTAEEYARGALLVSRQASPLARPGVRAGVCVMAGAIAACTAPASLRGEERAAFPGVGENRPISGHITQKNR